MMDGMRRNMRQYGMLFALGLIVVLFAVWTNGDLLLPRNVSNLVLQNSYILILAIGMMLVIIAGHIDLSVGSLTAFVGAVGAVLMVNHDISWPSPWCCVWPWAPPRAPRKGSSSRISAYRRSS